MWYSYIFIFSLLLLPYEMVLRYFFLLEFFNNTPNKKRFLMNVDFFNHSSSPGESSVEVPHCSLENASAFAFCLEDGYLISYWYADSWIAHLCKHDAAMGGIPFFGPNSNVRGWWSVNNVKRRPYRNCWNLRIAKIMANASFSIT